MATTIAVLSQKGGTGKTTMTRTLTDVFGRLGLDVLAIDADPQGNLSDYFDTEADAHPTLADVIQGEVRAADAIHGQVIPANMRLAESELMLAGKIGREVTLRNALRDLKRSKDMILIDCPPTLGLLTVNALVAADHALLSTEAQYFSLQGVEQALSVLDLARDSLNPELDLLGVVLNIANMRTNHAKQTLEALRERFGDKVCRTVIRQSIAYAESAERAIPILDYRPDRGSDYLSLAGECCDASRDPSSWLRSTSSRPSSSLSAPRRRIGRWQRSRLTGAPWSAQSAATTTPGTPTTSMRSWRCTRPTWCSRTTPPTSAPRARRCAATSARSSRPGPTSASRAGAPTAVMASWCRSGRRPRPTRTRCAAATWSPSRPARPSSWDGLDVIPFENGLVKRKDVYSDSVTILSALGLL